MKFEHMTNDPGNPLGVAGLFELINLEFNSISNFHESQQKQHGVLKMSHLYIYLQLRCIYLCLLDHQVFFQVFMKIHVKTIAKALHSNDFFFCIDFLKSQTLKSTLFTALPCLNAMH